jgi:hypothetical protein
MDFGLVPMMDHHRLVLNIVHLSTPGWPAWPGGRFLEFVHPRENTREKSRFSLGLRISPVEPKVDFIIILTNR